MPDMIGAEAPSADVRVRPMRRRGFLAAAGAVSAAPFIIRSARAADNTIVLGSSLPLSGPAAPTGITTQRTINHALEVINEKGIMIGGTKYTMVVQHYDNKYVPAEAVTVVEKMLSDGVRYLFSSGSGNSVPVVEKTTELKCVQLSAASGKDHLTNPKYPFSFRVQPCNETAYAVYPWIKTTYPEVKRIANIGPSDEAGFTETADRRMLAKKYGFTSGANEFFKRGALDFYPVATRLAEDKPDLIDFGGTIGRDQGLAVKALRELGYKGKILLGYSDAQSFVQIATPEAAEGTILFDTLAEPQNDSEKQLHDWWIAKYGPPMPSFAYLMWDWPFMLAQAIQDAGSIDTTKVADSLRKVQYHGLFGLERFGMKSVYGLDCSLTRDIPMSVIKNGKPAPLDVVNWPVGV
ncbi:MAG TPA: ABC transporter substrate-binding protein [Rhodopila sp.]|uniref:ABC transporter substrate-binding protein n=1 Tax=Rhodopila sp. TaxID=2480087 RepID=UPI002C541D61|nr:ABC transporter substrate-binding protein [Rhodopila sp.]HVY14322.1 ABC transporter substrate-binding protein [Rhodopila sp.]